MHYFSRDDIAQIGTPPGPGLVGALRVSGENAFAILARAANVEGLPGFPGCAPKRGVFSGRISFPLSVFRRHEDGMPARISETFSCPARFYLMPGPSSYTREDVAEIHLPGSPVILKAALSALIAAGARAALPGEFTFRAFRNGRLSLAQAEAVEELVRSGDDAERRRALSRLGDRDISRVAAWQDRMMAVAARLEAALDFSEEELDGDAASDLAAILSELEKERLGEDGASSAADSGLPTLALVGLANAGKSSLFNALLADDSSLVSPVASTTRDSLRREVEWHGTKMILSDNPGYHPEGEGGGRDAADRAFSRLGGEDLALWVVDGARPPGVREAEFARRLRGKCMVVINKSDLPAAASVPEWRSLAEAGGAEVVGVHPASAVSGAGLEELKAGMSAAAKTASAGEYWSRREALELVAAVRRVRDAANELAGAGRLELAAEDVREAVSAFSRAMGDGYAEETLARIFSRFCIGK